MFELIREELKHSAYSGLLSAGVVLTGGSSQLPGIRSVAASVLKMPVRIAQPEHLSGMADQLHSPSFSTSVGLLRLGLIMDQEDARRGAASVGGDGARNGNGRGQNLGKFLGGFGGFIRRLLPDDE